MLAISSGRLQREDTVLEKPDSSIFGFSGVLEKLKPATQISGVSVFALRLSNFARGHPRLIIRESGHIYQQASSSQSVCRG